MVLSIDGGPFEKSINFFRLRPFIEEPVDLDSAEQRATHTRFPWHTIVLLLLSVGGLTTQVLIARDYALAWSTTGLWAIALVYTILLRPRSASTFASYRLCINRHRRNRHGRNLLPRSDGRIGSNIDYCWRTVCLLVNHCRHKHAAACSRDEPARYQLAFYGAH